MKNYKIITIFLLLLPFMAFGQEEKTKDTLSLSTRYTEKGVEIFCITSEKEVMRKLLRDGYVIERSDDGINFQPIQEVHHTSIQEFDRLITQGFKDENQLKAYKFVKAYFKYIDNIGILSPKNFAKGLEYLKEVTDNEDRMYLYLLLASLKYPELAKDIGILGIDTTAKKGKTYYYRVKPLAKFTYYEVSCKPIKIVTGAKKDYTKKIEVIQGDGTLGFNWERTDLIGYFVERKAYNETEYKPMHKGIQFTSRPKGYKGETKSAFDDKGLVNYKPYSYRFYANTFWGEKVLFGEVTAHSVDKTPPPAPFLPQPKHTKPDEVTIKWEVKKEAPDLFGFVVARGTSPNGEFKVLHNRILPKTTRTFIDKSFRTDTLNYYLVQAIDTARNISSSNSALVVIIDSIPPKKPEFIKTTIDKKGVVRLVLKKGTEKDLMGYRVFKANSPKHEFSVIYEGFKHKGALDSVPTLLTDTTTLQTLTPYVYYKVKALDTHYNESEFSEMVKLKRPDTIPPSTPVFTKVLVSKDKVTLHFSQSESEDVVGQYLYRKINRVAEWQLLDTLAKGQKEYVDSKVTKKITYYYSMRAKDDSNLYSPYATPVFARPYDNGVRPPITNLRITEQEKNAKLTWEYAEKNADTFFVIYKSNDKGQLIQYERTTELQMEVPKNASYGIKVFTKDGGQSKISETVKL